MDGLPALAQIIGIGGAGAGLFGNIMNSITRGNAISQMTKNENLSPEALAAKVSAATKPLDQSLVENIQNQVQADVASRGLAQAPGVFAAEESQAIAPAEQQNQQTALQLILRQLGIPEEILASTQGSSDPMAALMMLMLRNQSGGGGGNFTDVTPDYLDPSYLTQIADMTPDYLSGPLS